MEVSDNLKCKASEFSKSPLGKVNLAGKLSSTNKMDFDDNHFKCNPPGFSKSPLGKADLLANQSDKIDFDDDVNRNASGFSKSPLGKALSKIGSGTSIIIGALMNLGEQEKITVASTAKAAITAGASTLVGSLLGGTPGLLLGLAIGSVVAYKKAKNSYSLREILQNLTTEQKDQLANDLMNALRNTEIKNLTPDKLPSLMNREDVKSIVIKILMQFLMHKLGMKLNQF